MIIFVLNEIQYTKYLATEENFFTGREKKATFFSQLHSMSNNYSMSVILMLSQVLFMLAINKTLRWSHLKLRALSSSHMAFKMHLHMLLTI